MVSIGKSTVFAVFAAVLGGAVLAGCARDEVVYRGSIKDSHAEAEGARTQRVASASRDLRVTARPQAVHDGNEQAGIAPVETVRVARTAAAAPAGSGSMATGNAAAAVVLSVFSVNAMAQTAAPPAKPECGVRPQYPGALATDKQMNNWRTDIKTYVEWQASRSHEKGDAP